MDTASFNLPRKQSGDSIMDSKPQTTEAETTQTGDDAKEVLIVTSKLKNYIRSHAGMNTSGSVVSVLSERVRRLCDEAIENAKREGRKTVMDRDFG